ncbi:unnamed protein product [Lota lota]
MSLSSMTPPQKKRSLGPVSPKRFYRSVSLRLRRAEPPLPGEADAAKRYWKATLTYQSLWEAVENEDTLAVQSLLSPERNSAGGAAGGRAGGMGSRGGSLWERGGGGEEKREKDWEREREREKWVNRVSEQGLVPLDVAALTHNSPLLQVLAKAGARHNPVLCQPTEWSLKLDMLVSMAGQRVEERREELERRAGSGPQVRAEVQRQMCLWSLRQQLYCRMRDNFHSAELPGAPGHVLLLVTSSTSLFVGIREPDCQATGLVTRYRVECSSSPDFKVILGSVQVTDTKTPSHSITDLTTGVHYFVRVSAYNVKGWGPSQCSTPVSAAPSSWTECVGVKSQVRTREEVLRKVMEEIREPQYRGYCIESSKPQGPSKRRSVSRGIKQLFQSATKFVRLLQRGVYLATVFYYKENILVTSEDQLPLVEIQCCSTSIIHDFLWFAKLSCAWRQVPWLQAALSSAHSSPSSLIQNRNNILRAVAQLQSSLGTMDLGQVYYEPLKDRQGNVLLVTIKEISDPASPPEPPLHWVPLARLEKNRSRTALLPEPTAIDTLTEQLKEKLSYHRHSLQWPQAGLYVGILKLCSSVNQIRVLVPQRLPSLLCHTRVRHNAHVSREEWTWLQSHVFSTTNGSVQNLIGDDEGQLEGSGLVDFVRSLRTAVTLLLTKLSIPLYRAYQYGVYTRELLEFGDKLSMLLLLPPSEDFGSSYWPLLGTKEPGLTLPLQVFELIHFWTYEQDFVSQYCQAWVRLELDSQLAQQALREALDTQEVQDARERLTHISQLSQRLDAVWRDSRWIMDCLQCVRSRQWVGAVPLGLVMGGDPPSCPDTEEEEESLTARCFWPPRLQPHRTMPGITGDLVRATPALVSPEVGPAAPGLLVPQQASSALLGGVAKGGYPVDISAQLDLTELGNGSSMLQQGLMEPALKDPKVGYDSLMAPTIPPFSTEEAHHHSISKVLEPMEMAELVDILPTLSLIEEETLPSDCSSPTMMEMLQSFGLGIGEPGTFFTLDNLDLTNEVASTSLSDAYDNHIAAEAAAPEGCWENKALQGAAAAGPLGGPGSPSVSDGRRTDTLVVGRAQVEWVTSSHESS